MSSTDRAALRSAQLERRTSGSPAGRRRSRPDLLAPLLAGLLAGVVYINALDNPFVYDDYDTVVANPSLTDLSNIRFILRYSPFRPVVNASYALDRWIWGAGPFGYHLTSVLLHAISVVLLYGLLRRLLDDARPASRGAPDSGTNGRTTRIIAWTAAAIFAVHPLFTEAVGYISGRSEVLCAIWFLSSLLFARRAIKAGSTVSGTAAVTCGALALASKEVAIALPVVALAYDWLLRPGPDDARRRRLWRIFAPLCALGLAAGIYRLRMLSSVTSAAAGIESAVLNGLTQAVVIWRYMALLAWPAHQGIVHDVRHVTSVLDAISASAVAGLLLVTFGAFRLRRAAPLVPFGILWFLATLAPSSSVVALREGMAEHRVYLASAGLLIAGAAGLVPLAGRLGRSASGLPTGYGLAVALVLAVLSTLTIMRNQVWASPVTLWTEATVRARGLAEPHYALADALRDKGQCDAAVPEYQQVVSMSPAHRDAYTNLGICLGQTGHLEEAEAAFRRALQIDPSFARGYTNLGALAIVAGDLERARDFYRDAIVQDPRNVLARLQLASLYEHTFHDYHQAARMCGEARALAPATPGVVECVERNQRLAAARDSGRQ